MLDQETSGWLIILVSLLVGSCGPSSEAPTDAGHIEDAGRPADLAIDAYVPPPVCRDLTSGGGGPCGCDLDCPVGGICGVESATGIPGGTCVVGCDLLATPPAGTECVATSNGTATLAETCTDTARCRTGWACIVGVGSGAGSCDVQCSRDTDCVETGSCNLYSGLCEPLGTGLGLNAPCTRDAQCESGSCWALETSFCAVRCNTLDPVCPEDGLCRSISADPAYTMGLCFKPCVDGTCDTGFTCSPSNACLPN